MDGPLTSGVHLDRVSWRGHGLGRLSSIIGLLCLVTAGGCSTIDRPSGRGFPSSVAQNVLRVAIDEAYRGADLSPAAEKRLDVTVKGFAVEDEDIHSYMTYAAEAKAAEAGALLDDETPEMHMVVAVYTCGTDLAKTPELINMVWLSAVLAGEAHFDIIFIENGQDARRQTLHGLARTEKTVILSVFRAPGHYQVKRDGRFVAIDPKRSPASESDPRQQHE